MIQLDKRHEGTELVLSHLLKHHLSLRLLHPHLKDQQRSDTQVSLGGLRLGDRSIKQKVTFKKKQL